MKPTIDKAKAQKLISKGALLVDVRNPVAYRDGSIAGAINVPLRRISELQKYPKVTCVILFSDENDDGTLSSAMNYVRQFGFDRVYSLGDKSNWNK